jgi:hypothetical protein
VRANNITPAMVQKSPFALGGSGAPKPVPQAPPMPPNPGVGTSVSSPEDYYMSQSPAAMYPDQGGGGGGGYYDDGGAAPQYAEPSQEVSYAPEGTWQMAPTQEMMAPEPEVKKIGLIQKIINWILGKPSSFSGEKNITLADGACALVERARVGDQNAMAMIQQIRANAMNGNQKSVTALNYITRYIHQNPVTKSSKKLGPGKQAQVSANCISLAEGPVLSDERIREIADSFASPEEKMQFIEGFVNHQNGRVYPSDSAASNLGRTIGFARGLQAIADPRADVSDFSPIIGWELGE